MHSLGVCIDLGNRLRTGRVNSVKTPSTVHQVELQHITAKTTTERWSGPLLGAALLWHASCSLHPHCTKFEPATEQQDFFLFARTLVRVCLPTPLARCWWSRGRFRGSCTACRLSAHDPKAVQVCRMARQPLKIHSIEPLASRLALRRARERTLRAHGILSLRRGDYSITVLLAGTSYRDGFGSQL